LTPTGAAGPLGQTVYDRGVSGFSTRAIRAASTPPRVDEVPTAVPIYQSATFQAADAETLADVIAFRRPGFSYSRLGNPTVDAAAAAVAEIEGAEAGYGFASGMAAIFTTLTALVEAGDRIVASRALYGSTQAVLGTGLRRFGVEVAFVDPTDLAAVEAALAERPTRVFYVETIANPTTIVADVPRLVEIAHRAGALAVVDNTFASPYVFRPLEHGADLVVESATKWLAGHSDVLAGFVAGGRTLIEAIRDRQIETGGTLAPFSAFLVLRGIETLAVRMERHAATALALAAWLEGQDGVARVFYPGLASHPQAAVAARLFRTGGGMLAFELAGGRAAGAAFIDALTIPQRTASLGSVHTFVVHPPSTSQRQLSEAELAAAGIAPGLLRVSVGLEDLDDLVEDFERGLRAARGAGGLGVGVDGAGAVGAGGLGPGAGGPASPPAAAGSPASRP
jgi:cystathionine beta-lyase/cystathionine gamma-synthase